MIAGASAVGKTVIASRLIELNSSFRLIRSATTRQPRKDGHDSEYLYCSREEFLSAVEKGEMLEYMEYAGEFYGTPRTEILRVSGEGYTPLFILDLNGVESLDKAEGISPMSVYIYGDINTIEQRLYDRYLNPPSPKGFSSFVSRKEKNIEDYLSIEKYADSFYAFVKNEGTVSECAETILSLYFAFLNGEKRNEEQCRTTAALLCQSAMAKIGN